MTADDEERIVAEAAAGLSPRELAAEYGISEPEVLGVLDREASRRFSGESLRRALLLEAERLSRLEQHYFAKALGSGEGATAAAGMYVKLAERLAVLLGLNAPVASASVVIRQTVEATKVTSTDRIRAVLDQLRELPSQANGEALEGDSEGEGI